MKSNFKKATLLITGILVGGKLFAQNADTSHASNEYVKPFSGDAAYRTWSIGINTGILTPYTIFGSNRKQDFVSPYSELGYGGYIKKQITPAFGIQGDFLAGKLRAGNSQPDAAGNSFASFLLGSVDSADRIGSQELRLHNTDVSTYLQDDIKLNPRLTVNLGLRWDIMVPFGEKNSASRVTTEV